MTQAIRIHQTGGPEAMRLEEVDVPAPAPGEVRVRHSYAGLNFIDVYHRTGLYPLPLPAVLGQEGVGRVAQLGAGVTGLKVGDRVGYAGQVGAYAHERNIAAERLVPLPDDLDDLTAAAVLMKGMTAEYLVRRCWAMRKGDLVLVHAAAGGVGQLLCQWAKAIGATVIGAVSTPEKAQVARASGCDQVVVTAKRNFVADVRELTRGRGVDVAYDSVGQATFEGSLACLRPRGMLVLYGQSSGKVPPFDLGRLGGDRSLFVTRPALHAYVRSRAELLGSAQALFELVQKGVLRVSPPRKVPLADAAQAHRLLEARRTTGSTVLVIDEAVAAQAAPSRPAAKKAAAKAKAAKAPKAKAAKKKR